jgi:hypothetical protein
VVFLPSLSSSPAFFPFNRAKIPMNFYIESYTFQHQELKLQMPPEESI